MQRSLARVVGLVLAGVVVAGSGTAWSQGFGVYEQSACMTGRGGAGVAAPCPDASGVYFNPAGLSFGSTQVGLGAVLIGPRGTFTDNATQQGSTLNKKWYPGPNVYFSTPLGSRFAAGVGVFAPYGLTTDWPETSEGRFLGYKSVVRGVYLQPTLAFKVNDKVSIGGGVDITYLDVELRQRVDLAVQPLSGGLTFAQLNLVCPAALCGTVKPGTDFADIQLKGHRYHAGYNLGVLVQASKQVSFGARYLSGQRVKISNGRITTRQIPVPGVKLPVATPNGLALVPADTVLATQFVTGAKLSSQDTTSSIPLPDQFVAGVAVQATPSLKVLADYQFTRWSMFDELPIDGQYLQRTVVESYRNTHGIRLGAELSVAEKSVVRVGFDGHGGAAPPQTVTPNLPEGKRQEYTVGFGTQLSSNVRLDLAYMYLHQSKRDGRTGDGGLEFPTTAQNNGFFKFKANILNAAVSLRF